MDYMGCAPGLVEIGLGQYAMLLATHGFETWQDILGITESDLEQVGMLLGHRRKLQRAIRLSATTEEGICSSANPALKQKPQKRRYRRRPRRDAKAPARPKNAYQLFADNIRRQTQDSDATFVELARLVSSNWAAQTADERKAWTSQALMAKTKYLEQSSIYQNTQAHSQYQQYLQDFKSRQLSSSCGGQRLRDELGFASHTIDPNQPIASGTTSSGGFQSSQAMSGQQQMIGHKAKTYVPVVPKERTMLDSDQCCGERHSLPPSLRVDGVDPTLKVSNATLSSTTIRSDQSLYFQTVLHG